MNLMERFHRFGASAVLASEKEVLAACSEKIGPAHLIDVQPVLEMMQADGDAGTHRFFHLPIVPPFPLSFTSYLLASPVRAKWGANLEIGVLTEAFHTRLDGQKLAFESPQGVVEARWILNTFMFMRLEQNNRMLPLARVAFTLDENGVGQFDDEHAMTWTLCAKTPEEKQPKGEVPIGGIELINLVSPIEGIDPRNLDNQDSAIRTLQAFLNPSLFAFALLNCKNVVLDENLPSRQVRRDNERRKLPTVSVYTLRVESPGTSVVGRKVESSGAADLKRLHICRGHFSTYTEERKLFGKYAGTFWIPAHVRGSEKAGKVIKDYAVHPRNK